MPPCKVSSLSFLCLIAGLIAGCGQPEAQASKTVPPKPESHRSPADPWLLTCSSPTDPTQALLWNGLLGFRFARDASAKGQPFFAIDEYDTGGEEKIRELKNPLPNGFLLDGKPLPITSDYSQTIDMKTSIMTTSWKSGSMQVKCETILDPRSRIIGESWTVTGVPMTVKLDFDLGAVGTLGNNSKVEREATVSLGGMKERMKASIQNGGTTITCVAAFTPSPNSIKMRAARLGGDESLVSSRDDLFPAIPNFDILTSAVKATWAKRWHTDIEIDGPVEDQQAAHSFLFYLQSAVNPHGEMAISPFGLSSSMYKGHVFWDSDIWVFPALALIDPDKARILSDYRAACENTAIANSKGNGAKYPWESSVTGKETVPGSSQKELHITGDVAWMTHQASALGLLMDSTATAIQKECAQYLHSASTQNPSTHKWEIKDVMSPDENHVGDNDLYTNLLAEWLSGGGRWNSKEASYKLPQDDKSLLSYDGDKVKSYKQAAAVLSIYPLQYPPAEAHARTMMDRFADKPIKNGPAMTDSIHGIIWARLGEPDKAYKAWRDSWEPFTNQPFMLFSEKRTRAETYFTTGAAGSLQTILFGFLGIRLDSVKEQDASWSKQLLGGNWLSVKANFPHQWKSVKLRNFTVLGHQYTLTATHLPNGQDAAQVIQGD